MNGPVLISGIKTPNLIKFMWLISRILTDLILNLLCGDLWRLGSVIAIKKIHLL